LTPVVVPGVRQDKGRRPEDRTLMLSGVEMIVVDLSPVNMLLKGIKVRDEPDGINIKIL
jgi:hypothetical protein